MAPPEIKGQFFYSDDMQGFNFRRVDQEISPALDQILLAGTNPDVDMPLYRRRLFGGVFPQIPI